MLVFVLQWLSLHWEILIMLLSQFPTFQLIHIHIHCIASDYSHADWDGLCDHLRDVPWEDIFKLGASAAASEFCEWVQVGLMYRSLIENIRSSLIHLHGFQLLVLLP